MPIKKKMIISWILVVIWAFFIFIMSDMDTKESNEKSKTTINEVVEKTVKTTNKLGITVKYPSDKKMKLVIDKLNKPLRKLAHASEYFVFTILLIIALKNSNISGKKIFLIALLICFIYACSDEYHQTFVKGRTGRVNDILIDTFGGLLSCISYVLIKNIGEKYYSFKE